MVAVAVDVSSRTDRAARVVTGVDAVDLEAVAAVESREVEYRSEGCSRTEDHVGLTGIDSTVGVGTRVTTGGPDQDVGVAVAVEVIGSIDREAREVVGVDSLDPEAVCAVE